MKDPIIEEIRKIRNEHAKRFNYNLNAICEDFISHQEQYGDRLVRLSPRRINKSDYKTKHSSKQTEPKN